MKKCKNCEFVEIDSSLDILCEIVHATRILKIHEFTGARHYIYPLSKEIEKIYRKKHHMDEDKPLPPLIRYYKDDKLLGYVECSLLNSEGNCKYYTRKFWKFWVRGD